MTITERALAGEVICNIGQIDPASKRALERLVRLGQLVKWRGRWFPVTGAPWGMGPLKTCYATPRARQLLAA